MRMRLVVALALLASAVGCAMRVRGAVTDARTGQPVPGAFVSSDCYPSAVTTDDRGRYELKTRWSNCTLTVFKPGYRTRLVTVALADDRYRTQDVILWRAGDLTPSAAATRGAAGRPRRSR
jgi:hypothetical protein